MEIGKIFASIFSAIILLYIAYVLISSFAEITPEFAGFGWFMFIAIFFAVILGIMALVKNLFS